MRQERQKRRNSAYRAAGLAAGLLALAMYAVSPVPVCASTDSVSIVVSDPEADQKAADKVSEMLKALPAAGELTGDDEKAVTDVLHAYSQLTDQQKALVQGRERISTLRQELAEAKNREAAAQVEVVNQLIQALSEAPSITLANEDAVKNARTAYNSLTDDQKASIANLSRLEAAEAKIDDLRSRISTFTLDKNSDDVTIIARFKTSGGTNKVPQFTLKGPGEGEYILTPSTRKMEYSEAAVSLYWMESYVQIDIVNGAYGAWTLEATQPRGSHAHTGTDAYAGTVGQREDGLLPLRRDDSAHRGGSLRRIRHPQAEEEPGRKSGKEKGRAERGRHPEETVPGRGDRRDPPFHEGRSTPEQTGNRRAGGQEGGTRTVEGRG